MRVKLRDGTGTKNFKYVIEDMDRHGNVRVYLRRNGHKIRLRETPGTPEFEDEYRKALEGGSQTSEDKKRPPVGRGSLRWLVEKYYGSAEFRLLGKGTQYVRRGILDGICEQHGAKPYNRLEAHHVRTIIRDEKADFPEAANARVKALRQTFKWAVEVGHADVNPAREVPYLKSKNPGGWHTWTEEEVSKFEDRHPIGTKPRLALALGLLTGVRRSDAVRLWRQMERDNWLYFTEKKGEAQKPKDRAVPILQQLREVLDETKSGHLTYLVTQFGRPFTPAGFGNWFRRRCDEADLPHCSFHGLRKAGATIAAENGATEHELMAIFGWDSPKQAALYTKAANRKKLAGDAMHLLVQGQTENESVPLSEGGAEGGTKKAEKA